MHKKAHKKKRRRARGGDDGKNKENVEEQQVKDEVEAGAEVTDDSKPCYEVKTSEIMGRYLVARREIRPGEVIVKAEAVAVGPCAGCPLVCLACYRQLDDSIARCKGCQWPLCSPACYGLGQYTGHSTYECAVLKDVPPNYDDLEDLKDCYHAIMPLRCLLLKKHDPEKWAALCAMESHNALRRARGDIWPMNDKHVVRRLRDWRLPFDEEEIHTVCGVLEVNAFEVGGGGGGGAARALYPAACLLAHRCVPSTAHTDAERARARPLTVRAATHHKPGDLISLCYAYTLQGTLKRQEHIQHSKFFSCRCERCSDPTELGTHASAFRCPHCEGLIEPTRPLERTHWACDRCGYTMTDGHVRLLIDRLTDEFEQIDANDVKGFEGFLHRYRNVLYSGHYLCLSAKHSLSQLYGKVAEYMIQEMPAAELQRKVAVCRDLMKAFDVIEPGYSRLRGITLYELHAPLMILTTRDFEKKAITKEALRDRLKEIVCYLTEAALILGFEPAQSPEGLMAAAARDALTKIKTWEQIIGKIS